MRIISTTVRFGGAAHDAFVFNNSVVKQKLQQEYEAGARNSYLLGMFFYLFCIQQYLTIHVF